MGVHFRLLLASFIHKVFLQFGILSIVYIHGSYPTFACVHLVGVDISW